MAFFLKDSLRARGGRRLHSPVKTEEKKKDGERRRRRREKSEKVPIQYPVNA